MLRERKLSDLILDRALYALAEMMRKRASKKDRFTHICVPMNDVIGMRLFSTGSFEQTQLDGVLDFLDENPPDEDAIFLDVGGNIGVYSILLRDRFKTVFSFEPNTVTYEILKANLGLSGARNVKAVNMALSDRQDQVPIFIPRNGNLGWATLDASHHDIAVDKVDIKCTTLDAFVEENHLDAARIKMIKIDVEGHETSVISGGVETLAKHKTPLLCEVLSDKSGADLISKLDLLGYTSFEVFRRDVRKMFSTRVRREPFDVTKNGKAALVLAR